MVQIPTDIGLRLRTQTEAPLAPIIPTTDVALDLSDLPPGKVFTAQIQEVLPENTFKALVAGRQLTLALPQGAKAGDILELVVIDRSPRVVVAQLANPTADGTPVAQPYEFMNLSKAAQLIGSLLARDGQTPAPVALTRGQALLPQAPTDARQMAAGLAPQLAKAVSESGLFYEAHQAQWVTGKRPLNDLLSEPQARLNALLSPSSHDSADATDAVTTQRASEVNRPTGIVSLLQSLLGLEEAAPESTGPAPSNPTASPQSLPEELRPIVQQQLDAAATQRLAWHGDIWPQQSMQWQIQRDGSGARQRDDESDRNWTSTLKLTTPRLGEIDARLKLTSTGVHIAITTVSSDSAGDLRQAIPALEDAMVTAGIQLLSVKIAQAKPTQAPLDNEIQSTDDAEG